MRILAAGAVLLLMGCEDRGDGPAAGAGGTSKPAAPMQGQGAQPATTQAGQTVLQTESGEPITNATDEQIRQQVSQLDAEFAILSRNEMTYIQVWGDAAKGFLIEYQEGSLERHYRSEREDFALEQIVRALIAYRDGTIDWSSYGPWSRMELPPAD